MSSQSFTIWCNAKWPERAAKLLHDGIGPHRLILAAQGSESVLDAGGHDPALDSADIAFGQPDPLQLISAANVRWTHLTSAGYARYDKDSVRQALRARGALLTNSSSVFDEPCAEHVMAMMYALARRLPDSLDEQRRERRWTYLSVRAQQKLLVGQTVLLVGFGAIARRLVELLLPLRMKILAVRRTPAGDEPVPTFAVEEIDRLLHQADHVVNILPESTATGNFFDPSRLARMKPTAHFYNIGRGTTVDHPALMEALASNRLGAAYLDVFDPEPLAPEDPLWTTPNCFITPHTAGGHEEEYERLVQHFLDNLRRFERGEALADRIA